uniref:Uncharacterized protein n=1 Tax=Ditylenchus dipsaci TaxID=166011 RepID=A0A915DFF7_9BILA
MATFREEKCISQGEKMLFLQVFLISILNFVAGSTFSYINYNLPSEWIMHFAMFSWFHIHGFPPVIYLVLNKTIRKDTYKMLFTIYCKITGTTTTAPFSVTDSRTFMQKSNQGQHTTAAS